MMALPEKPLNVVFCGSPEIACPALGMLSKHPKITISCVISQPDKIRTRGRNPSPTAVKALATSLGLHSETPESKAEFSELIHHLKPDLIIVIAYGMIIPKDIVDHYTLINCHGSLLPKYRGASPIQAALLNGDEKTGITLMEISENMDSGNIISMKETSISNNDTFGSVYERLSSLSSEILEEFLSKYSQIETIQSSPQNHEKASYCKKIQKNDLELNLNDETQVNFRKIKAFSPEPGAFIIQQNKRIKILDATLINGHLSPSLVQPEGKKPMSYSDYLKGYQQEINLC
jgi:methionyl-tRNA formyltransferase